MEKEYAINTCAFYKSYEIRVKNSQTIGLCKDLVLTLACKGLCLLLFSLISLLLVQSVSYFVPYQKALIEER